MVAEEQNVAVPDRVSPTIPLKEFREPTAAAFRLWNGLQRTCRTSGYGVCCRGWDGTARSLLVIAYLCWAWKWAYADAVKLVLTRRPRWNAVASSRQAD